MKEMLRTRLGLVLAFLLLVALLGAGVWRYGYVQALDGLARRGVADLALASDRITAQLQRYRELAVLMADHPIIGPLEQGADTAASEQLFQSVADKTAALNVMFVSKAGQVIASARPLGNTDLAAEPYVRRAMNGALGARHAAGAPIPGRAYYFAAPAFGPDGNVRGALVVAADIAEIEWDWTGSNPAVFFSDSDGVVFITNRSELTFWRRADGTAGLKPPKGPERPFEAWDTGGHEVWQLDWGPYLPRRALHITRDLPVIGMRGEALLDVAPALRLAGLQASAVMGLCLAFGAVLLLLIERRRTLAEANAQLGAHVAERTQALSDTNTALRQAQSDLVQAGKLSALGQMSAGISHELNQPLMAIQSFAENGASYLERGKPDKATENLTRIEALAGRMGRIIRNLRAFARQESAPMTRVDLVSVLQTAVELTQPAITAGEVTLQFDPPDAPIWVRGGEVRLGQVFVNLISNAVDAMAGQETRVLGIDIHDGARLSVTISDTGPGIDVPDKVFEPFYSTKAAAGQDGMGLGLSISYGIVQSFGGDIRGANSDNTTTGGGAVFTVELDHWTQEQAA